MVQVLIFLAGMLALFGFIMVVGIIVQNRTDRNVKLNQSEHRELEALRELRDSLLMKAVDRVEVEPFAVEVLNQIRDTQRSISNP